MTNVATVYGEALYALAHEDGLGAALLTQLETVEHCFAAEPGYFDLLACRSLSKDERCHLLDESLSGSVHPYLLNFLKILVEKGYIRQFPRCCESYRQCHYRDEGILPVQARTALPLSPEQSKRLSENLSAITKKHVLLTNQVDRSLLGGIRLDYDGQQLEDSISQRLDEIRKTLKNTVL